MARWVDAGGAVHALDTPDDHETSSSFIVNNKRGKRPILYDDDDFESYDTEDFSPPCSKRPRYDNYDHRRDSPDPAWPSHSQHLFFVLREGRSPPPEEEPEPQPEQQQDEEPAPEPVACFMERTHSGRTIISDDSTSLDCADFSASEDSAAAQRVRKHLGNLRDTKHSRILESLIHPKGHQSNHFTLDNAALESIFSAADEIFFRGRLSQRVTWEWSTSTSNPLGNARIIGTTALRTAKRGGYETLIVLSSPILKDNKYNRRLLISTFLHELIHSYLFICCGFKARHCGGHTDGFKEIAGLIDGWAGRGTLHLCDMEADLEHFRAVERSPVITKDRHRRQYRHQHQPQQLQHQPHDQGHRHDNYDEDEDGYTSSPGISFSGRVGGDWSTGANTPTLSATYDDRTGFNDNAADYALAHSGRDCCPLYVC